MAKLNRDNQKGFTIVELVVVIIILGILAATALPRFLDVSEDAHVSAVDAVEGALNTGITTVKAGYLVTNKVNPVVLDTQSFEVNASGFATGITGDTTSAVCGGLFTGLVKTPVVAVASTESLTSAADIGGVDVAGIEWYAVSNNDSSITSCDYFYLGRGFLAGNKYVKLTHTLSTGVVVKSSLGDIGA